MPALLERNEVLVGGGPYRVRAWGFTHAGLDLAIGGARAMVPACYPYIIVNASVITMLGQASEWIASGVHIDCLECIAKGWR